MRFRKHHKVINKEWMEFNLVEAEEQIGQILETLREPLSVEEPEDYGLVEHHLFGDFEHLYHHLNTAWNGRFRKSYQDENFRTDRMMPKDLAEILRIIER